MTHGRFVAGFAVLAIALWLPPVPLSSQRSAPAAVAALASFGEPAISPDRSEIAVVSGGDIWTVPLSGGDARLLVAHEATETRPIYSPDGDRLAFVSDRTGGGDIYVLALKGGALTRVTMDDGLERIDGWSRDGKWLYFSSTSRDIAAMNDIYRVRPEGGTPMAVSADRYTSEFFAAPSPDGQTIAFSARGNSAAQWWRKGRSHLDESEIWLLRDFGKGAAAKYERLTDRGAKQMWPMWTADGKSLYFVSDRSGAQNVWSLAIGGAAKQVTRFTDGRVLWPTISYDGRTIVFERDFEVWTLDTGSGQTSKVSIAKRGLPPRPAVEHVTINGQFQDLALSPDGRKVVFAARGEIWAAGARDGGDAVRVTTSYARESQIVWTPDSRAIVYVSERDDIPHLFRYDFTTGREAQVTRGAAGDAAPQIAPDGKSAAFIRDGKELRTIDLASGQERVLASGHLSRSDTSVAWSPDSRWVAYLGLSAKSFRNVFVVPAAGGDPKAVSALPNGSANNIVWSPDGTYILYTTNQRTEQNEVVRVDLILRTPKFREDRFRDLFRPDAPPRREPPSTPAPGVPGADDRRAGAERDREPVRDPSKPVEIVFDDIRRRISVLPVGVDVTAQAISPDGRLLLLTAAAEGQQNLYTYSLDELAREPAVARQLTSTSGAKADAQFSPDNREVFYLEQGRLTVMPIETRQARAVAINAEMDVDFAREKIEVFRQAWRYMRDGFYDDKYHGVDWNRVRDEYAPRIAGSETPAEMRRLLNLMVGELNASHMGVAGGAGGGGRGGEGPAMGRLGLRFDRDAYEQTGKLKISGIVPLGPVAITRQVTAGEYLTSIDGTAISGSTSVDDLLAHSANRRTAAADFGGGGWHQPARSRRPADLAGDREEPALPRVGRIEPRLRRQGERRPPRLRAHERHVRGRAPPFLPRSRRRQPQQGRRRRGRAQQQRRLRQRLCDRRPGAPRLPDDDAARPPHVPGAQHARPARAGAADDPGHQSALALGRRGFHRRLPDPEAGQGCGRADVRLDHLHRHRHARRRIDDADAGSPHHDAGRHDDGAEPAAGGHPGDAADRGEPHRQGQPARCGRAGAPAAAGDGHNRHRPPAGPIAARRRAEGATARPRRRFQRQRETFR